MADEKVIIELDIKTDKAVAATQNLIIQQALLKKELEEMKKTESDVSEAYIRKEAQLKVVSKELNSTRSVLVGLTQAEEDDAVTVQKLVAKNAELRFERDRTNIATKEGQDRIREINKEMDANTNIIRENADAQKSQSMNVGAYKNDIIGAYKELKNLAKEYNANAEQIKELTKLEGDNSTAVVALTKRNEELKATSTELAKVSGASSEAFTEYTDVSDSLSEKLKELPGSAGGAASGFMGMVKAAWAFVATPIGAIITAVAAALYLVYVLFKNFDPLLDKIEQGIAAVGAVLSVLKEAFIGFLTGSKSLTDSFSNLGSSMANAANEAIKLKKAQQDLDDSNVAMIESGAKAKQLYDELILQSKDRTKTEEERIALIDKALEVEAEAFKEKQRIAEGEYDIMLGNIKNQYDLTDEQAKNIKDRGVNELRAFQSSKGITDEEIKALAEASAKRYEVLQESTNLREKAINRQNALSDKFEEDEVKRLEKNKAANEKAHEQRRIADEKIAKAKEEADKKAIDDAKKLVDEKLNLLDLELRDYLANNQSKLDGQNAYNDQSILIEQARLGAIYDKQLAYLQIQKDAGLISQKEFEVASLEAQNEYENQKIELENAFKEQNTAQKLAEYEFQFGLDQELLSQSMFGEFDAKLKGLDEQQRLEKEFANKTILTTEGKKNAEAKITAKYDKAEKAIKQAKFQAEMSLAGDFAKNIATIAGENTKVGKAASVAATTISTIQGGVAAFTGMSTAIPGPVGIGLGIAAAAAALVSGYKSVEKILSVNSGLPGDGSPSVGGGGASAPSISAVVPQVPQSVNPSLGQGIISRQVDSNGSATMKNAFSEALSENPLKPTLVTDDVTINQSAKLQQNKTQNI